ncbi:MAG: GNAT family N-acetyltransferase [Burkholderiaceae bacterium]|jgi:GNAT superfamily N-acetyltransferase|nr:GNAT family N-acetyltransferase [Burkholderiaceae bacterium]
MRLSAWHEEPIGKAHDRKGFDCGDADLNEFLAKYARQSHESGSAKTFCAIDNAHPGKILGFYSIAPAQLDYERMPQRLRKGLARHDVGGFRLARLATDRSVQGQGLGGQLLGAAARRAILAAEAVGGLLLVIDAKNEQAANWYAGYGGIGLDDAPRTLVMSLATFAAGLKAKGNL